MYLAPHPHQTFPLLTHPPYKFPHGHFSLVPISPFLSAASSATPHALIVLSKLLSSSTIRVQAYMCSLLPPALVSFVPKWMSFAIRRDR